MYSPRPPPSLHSTTSFASVTDPTLHRQGWRSPRANEEALRPHPRKIPNRFRSLLRYDALSPSPVLMQEANARPSIAPPLRAASQRISETDEGGLGDQQWTTASAKKTNLDELTWFQHRWLDKHGKNSHLKESREKMALLRRWFESLDADGSGEVGLDELEDPLVSVGLARSRDEVQRLIDQVDKDGSGEVTFAEFLRMMTPDKPKRARQRQPLHKSKPPLKEPTQAANPHHAPNRLPSSSSSSFSSSSSGSRRRATVAPSSSNPVVKLFEDMQSGKLGDLAIPFPVLITAYRRRMLLNAHMAEDPAARRIGTSVLQALESTRHELPSRLGHDNTSSSASHRRGSTMGASPSPAASVKSYVVAAGGTVDASPSTPRVTQLPSL